MSLAPVSSPFLEILIIPHRPGTWVDFVPIPTEKTLEAAETKLEDNTKFLQFIRSALTWNPDARPTARELLQHPWLID